MTQPTRVQIELGPRSYPVLIGSGLLAQLGEIVRAQGLKQTNAFVITNKTIGAHYFKPLKKALASAGFTQIKRHDIPDGEEGKNWKVFTKTCSKLLASCPETGAAPLVFLLGGGVVGDLGGFAAAVFRRGVPFVQLPTSLLAAVDSSVGGKVAVNFDGVKNIMGAFSQPRLVICDLDLLRSLGQHSREIRSGTAEIIKYGAVCSARLFAQLEGGDLEHLLALEPAPLIDIVGQCVQLKAEVVAQDEFDKKGIRNVLNFGHTIGHALELSSANPAIDDPLERRNAALSHGEAITIGMMAATHLARTLNLVDESFEHRLRALIARAGLPITFSDFRAKQPNPKDIDDPADLCDRVRRAMMMDKKFRDGKNVFVLPTQIGAWQQRENVDWALVDEAIGSVLR